ncbi:MAG: hypothetical protein WAW37_03095 [Syntrophobacteraceae bacterium]
MSDEERKSSLKDVKEKLEASGITKREIMAAALGACGALFLGLLGGDAQGAGPTNCAPESCALACYTCRDGCSSGPTK